MAEITDVDMINNNDDEVWVQVPKLFILKSRGKPHDVDPTPQSQYWISNKGRVKNKHDKFLKYHINLKNRKSINIKYIGEISIFRLMAYAFKQKEIEEFENKEIKWHADHKDEDCTNDTLENLQIISASENSIKSNKKCKRNIENGLRKPILQIDPKTKKIIKEWKSINDAIKYLKSLKYSNIKRHINRSLTKGGQTRGFYWKFKSDIIDGEIWHKFTKNKYLDGMKYSNYGRIMFKTGATTYGTNTASGYLSTSINRKSYLIHRIIAFEMYESQYIECKKRCRENEEPVVDHIDNNKTNNHIENLQWLTPCENTLKEKYKIESPVICLDVKSGNIYKFQSQKKAAFILNISCASISAVCLSNKSHANGYIFKFDDDKLDEIINIYKINPVFKMRKRINAHPDLHKYEVKYNINDYQ